MPPKASSKANESISTNICWSMASEEARTRYCQRNGTKVDMLYLPCMVSGTPNKNLNKTQSDSELYSNDTALIESIIADEILHTALRIHEEDETLLPYTKSKTIYWPWLAASRSVFLHNDILSLCKIGCGERVIIKTKDDNGQEKSAVYRAWPLLENCDSPLSIHLTALAARNIAITAIDKTESKVEMRKLDKPFSHAREIFLTPKSEECHKYLDELSFISVVSLACKDTFLAIGSTIVLNYYGQLIELRVSKMETSALDNSAETSGIENLVDNFKHSVSLLQNAESNIITSTPQKIRGSTNNDNPVHHYVSEETKIHLTRLKRQFDNHEIDNTFISSVSKIGGLSNEIKRIEESIRGVMSSEFRSYLGILLYGPTGTGKTLIGKSIEHLLYGQDIEYIHLNGCELYSKYSGETEANLRSALEISNSNARKVVFIDDFEIICNKPSENAKSSDQDRRIASTLRSIVDGISMVSNDSKSKFGKLVLLAASNAPDSIDPSFRRGGRLDVEVEIGVPTAKARREILKRIIDDLKAHEPILSTMEDDEIHSISDLCHGYVGADLKSLTSHAISVLCSEPYKSQIISGNSTNKSIVEQAFNSALKIIRPSAMREILVEVPNVSWNDIGGMEDLKLQLQQAVEWPVKYADGFRKFNIKPPRGLLMYGPPGCSKTLIAKAFAHESGLNFVSIKGPELFSKWVGESEEAVRALFRRARRVAPSIIFFDEIDALGSERGGSGGGSKVGDRVLAQMLTEMDGVEDGMGQVTILAATNRPDMIDKALMRPGRLDRIVYVPLPDADTRLAIIKVHTKDKPLAKDVRLEDLQQLTDGYSGAEIAAVCNEAAMKALEENVKNMINSDNGALPDLGIMPKHFHTAIKTITPRINKDLLKIYDEFRKESKTN